jgi:CheY-like chemotaxis protein
VGEDPSCEEEVDFGPRYSRRFQIVVPNSGCSPFCRPGRKPLGAGASCKVKSVASVLRTLVVDDSEVIRKAICKILQSLPEVQVVCEASDGSAAVSLARQHKPDLVLMDISMPGTDGLEVTRLIKQVLPKTKIIILSQHRSGIFGMEAIAAGADGYAEKDARELIAAVRKIQLLE